MDLTSLGCAGSMHVFARKDEWPLGGPPPLDEFCMCGATRYKDTFATKADAVEAETLVHELVDWRDGLVAKQRTRIFLDAEYTGLHQGTTLVSIGLVAEDGQRFYAESSDFAPDQVDDWLAENVIRHLWSEQGSAQLMGATFIYGSRERIGEVLGRWLARWDSVEMWGDCLAYDWMLFCELFGGALSIPANVYYIPFDLATLLNENGIDPDIDREAYAGVAIPGPKHNALHDALVIKACHDQVFLF